MTWKKIDVGNRAMTSFTLIPMKRQPMMNANASAEIPILSDSL